MPGGWKDSSPTSWLELQRPIKANHSEAGGMPKVDLTLMHQLLRFGVFFTEKRGRSCVG